MDRKIKEKIKKRLKAGTIYKTKRYANWRSKVFKRDRYKCQLCEKVGGYIEAHHIKLKSVSPELIFILTNGITLCGACHKSIHKEDNGYKRYVRKFKKLARENKPRPRRGKRRRKRAKTSSYKRGS